jgi:transcriptional regulator with XRE-family HTH domain
VNATDILKGLRGARRSQKLTQAELGKRAGYHRAQVLYYEKEARPATLVAVCNLAEALGYELVLRPKDETQEQA